jgi:cytochrome c-type biogenesis protein
VELLVVAFLAGILTILAPCVVSVIPILLARSGSAKHRRSVFFVIAGLSLSIIIFTVLLKATTVFIAVPNEVWRAISGGIIILFGVFTLLPQVWEWIVLKTKFVFAAQNTMGGAAKKEGIWGDLLLGASLGPVFSACSPTYALVVATILPVDPLLGLGYLAVFVAGLALMLALIAIFGHALTKRLGWGINPRGAFRRVLGVVLIVVGVLIAFGIDKLILGQLVESGWYDFQIVLESQLR